MASAARDISPLPKVRRREFGYNRNVSFRRLYRDQLRPSRAGTITPGLTGGTAGHTPGHAGYRLDSAGETLLIWGDTVHVPEIQVPRPQVTSEDDIDEPLAAESRRRIFDLVATER